MVCCKWTRRKRLGRHLIAPHPRRSRNGGTQRFITQLPLRLLLSSRSLSYICWLTPCHLLSSQGTPLGHFVTLLSYNLRIIWPCPVLSPSTYILLLCPSYPLLEASRCFVSFPALLSLCPVGLNSDETAGQRRSWGLGSLYGSVKRSRRGAIH